MKGEFYFELTKDKNESVRKGTENFVGSYWRNEEEKRR